MGILYRSTFAEGSHTNKDNIASLLYNNKGTIKNLNLCAPSYELADTINDSVG